jgi:hypothetical protein
MKQKLLLISGSDVSVAEIFVLAETIVQIQCSNLL